MAGCFAFGGHGLHVYFGAHGLAFLVKTVTLRAAFASACALAVAAILADSYGADYDHLGEILTPKVILPIVRQLARLRGPAFPSPDGSPNAGDVLTLTLKNGQLLSAALASSTSNTPAVGTASVTLGNTGTAQEASVNTAGWTVKTGARYSITLGTGSSANTYTVTAGQGYSLTMVTEELARQIKQGALYPVLRTLSANGLLASRVEPSLSGPPRRYYQITPAGCEVLARWGSIWRDTRDFVDRFAGGAAVSGTSQAGSAKTTETTPL